MNIAAIFIRRPVMTTLVMVAILLFGIMSYRQLPVSDLPNVDFPTIQVSASLPGASPDTIASAVAKKTPPSMRINLDVWITRDAAIDARWRAVHKDGSPFPGEDHPAMVTLATGVAQYDDQTVLIARVAGA